MPDKEAISKEDLAFLTRHRAAQDEAQAALEAKQAIVDSDKFEPFRTATKELHEAQKDSTRAGRVWGASLAAIVAKYDLDIRADGIDMKTGAVVRNVRGDGANLREARRVR